MPDSLTQTLLSKLGVRMPGVTTPAAPEVSPEQEALHQEMVRREQDKWSPTRKAITGGMEGVYNFGKGLLTGDPTQPFNSTGEGLGILAGAALPFKPKGIKGMYSRVEKIAESLPQSIHPSKLGSILRNRASQEEVGWRGVDKMLQEKSASGQMVTRDELISHLEGNPLDVNVVEKGNTGTWSKAFQDKLDALEQMGHRRTPEQDADYQRLISMENAHSQPGGRPNVTTYDNYVMPGASNYRESLIQLADNPATRTEDDFKKWFYQQYAKPADERSLEQFRSGYYEAYDSQRQPAFQSHHWDEPNVLVHVRHNERALPEVPFTPEQKSQYDSLVSSNQLGEAVKLKSAQSPVGRMLENVQSDWHQRGAHSGYSSDIPAGNSSDVTQATMAAREAYQQRLQAAAEAIDEMHTDYLENPGDILRPEDASFIWNRLAAEADAARAAAYVDGRVVGPTDQVLRLNQLQQDVRDAQTAYLNAQDAARRHASEAVPDAPFKDSWAELALKQQLLDIAHNRPDLQWLGIAPSNELRERGEVIAPVFQDEQLPRTLEKLLKPFGGGPLEKVNLGFKPPSIPYMDSDRGAGIGPYGGLIYTGEGPGRGQAAVNYLPGGNRTIDAVAIMDQIRNQMPDVQAPIARLTPEILAQLREKGFPLLMLLLAARQSQGDPNGNR